MNENIDSVLKQISVIFNSTDEILCEWNGDGNLQFPVLLKMLADKMNWDEKQIREADPIIRFYIRRNSDWHVTRGAHGGIMRASDKQKKDFSKIAKDSVKKQMQTALDAKVAAVLNNKPEDITEDIFIDK